MLLHCHPERPNPDAIRQAAEVLREGGIVIYPTDTIYGLGCSLYQPKAFEQLCHVAGLDPEKADPSFLFDDLSRLSEFTRPIPNTLFRVMKKALPGPYTFILEANNQLPKLFRNRKKTIGIRVPDNAVCRALVKKLGHPILNTSVHDLEDGIKDFLIDPEQIERMYGDKVDMILDAGPGHLAASTILDCTKDRITVIREGLGPVDEILA